jgi:thiosulfate dehydrogenase
VSNHQSTERRNREGAIVSVALCGAIGIAVVTASIAGVGQSAAGHPAITEEYGRRLIVETPSLMGPDQPNPEMRLTGSRLACTSCHLDVGARPGTLSLLASAPRYPRFSGRDGGQQDLVARINGCMTRSMNGRELARNSVEMGAMIAYLEHLAETAKATNGARLVVNEPAPFSAPPRAVDFASGANVFGTRCARCHGADGLGMRASEQPANGYVFPPLWGPDSFNNGAGMARVLTAAAFIKAKMPLGDATLTSEEAFDVAGYLNAQPRPAMSGLDADYPDRWTKPIDSPYGPYADPFPLEQHRFGPFGPIEAYHKAHRPPTR